MIISLCNRECYATKPCIVVAQNESRRLSSYSVAIEVIQEVADAALAVDCLGEHGGKLRGARAASAVLLRLLRFSAYPGLHMGEGASAAGVEASEPCCAGDSLRGDRATLGRLLLLRCASLLLLLGAAEGAWICCCCDSAGDASCCWRDHCGQVGG